MIVSLTRKSKKKNISPLISITIFITLKKVWQGINSIIANNKSRKCSVSSIYVNNNCDISSDPTIISNKFNDYFANVAKITRTKIPYSSKHFSEFLKNRNEKKFFYTLRI